MPGVGGVTKALCCGQQAQLCQALWEGELGGCDAEHAGLLPPPAPLQLSLSAHFSRKLCSYHI